MVSAATTAMAVRVPVPRSWVPSGDLHRPIGVDADHARSVVAAAAPGVHADAHAALDVALGVLSPRGASAFSNQPVRRPPKFFPVNFSAAGREIGVLGKELDRIHVEFGSQIIQRAHGERGGLRMVRARQARAGPVFVADRSMLAEFDWESQGRKAAEACRRPFGPPVPQECESHATSVPSFFAPTLMWA